MELSSATIRSFGIALADEIQLLPYSPLEAPEEDTKILISRTSYLMFPLTDVPIILKEYPVNSTESVVAMLF